MFAEDVDLQMATFAKLSRQTVQGEILYLCSFKVVFLKFKRKDLSASDLIVEVDQDVVEPLQLPSAGVWTPQSC